MCWYGPRLVQLFELQATRVLLWATLWLQMHAKCALLWATFGATLWTTSQSCAAMSHALAADARQMCAALSHVWCNSREDNCAFFWAAFLLPFQLCSTQDRLENSLSIFIFGIFNLTCYFPYDPRWVGRTFFCWRTIAPVFWPHSSFPFNSAQPRIVWKIL